MKNYLLLFFLPVLAFGQGRTYLDQLPEPTGTVASSDLLMISQVGEVPDLRKVTVGQLSSGLGILAPAASNPATRDDGSALEEGDSYYNTGDDDVYFYNGSSWATLASGSVPDATTSVKGKVELSTETELRSGTAGVVITSDVLEDVYGPALRGREFAGGVVSTRTGVGSDRVFEDGTLGALGPSDFSIGWSGRTVATTAGVKTLFVPETGSVPLGVALDCNSGSGYDVGSVKLDIGASAYVLDYGSDIFEVEANWLITADRDGDATLYRNGVSVATVDISGSSAEAIDTTVYDFGVRQNSGWLLRDVAIFTSALLATQAAEIYAQGVSGWLAANPAFKLGATGFEDFENGELASTVQLVINTSQWGVYGTHTNYDGAGDADSIGGAQAGDFCAKIVTTGDNGFGIVSTGANAAYTFVCEFWYYIKAGEPKLTLRNSTTMSICPQINFTVKDAWTKVRFSFRTGVGNSGIPLLRINNGTMYIDSMTITRIGANLHLPMTEGIGLQLHDASSNHNDALLSVSGVTHLKEQNAGYIRDFALDANGQTADIVDGSRDILPANAVIHNMVIINRDNAAMTAANVDLNRTDGSNTNTIATAGYNIAAGQGGDILPVASQDLYDRRLEIPDNSDAGMDNFDVEVFYTVLE